MPVKSSTQTDLSVKEARRIALAAQGLSTRRKPLKRPDGRHLDQVIDRLSVLQIDSVNVLERSHYLPLFSRLGPYRKDLLHQAAYGSDSRRRLFEYWGHEASLLPVPCQPLFRWRMDRAARFEGIWKGVSRFAREQGPQIEEIFRQITDRGPLGVSDLADDDKRTSPWWGWKDTKIALEWLFWTGRVTAAGRRNFERLYDLPERVFPVEVLNQATPEESDAQRQLVRIAAGALGVATERDLRDYFRLPAAASKARVAELVDAGELIPVTVEGWTHQAYLHPESALPARATGCALLSPFDNLIWERSRTERLFDFRFRLEIYTPAPKRIHGYYVLPFLLGDRPVARVDLKANRQTGMLEVRAAHAEPGADTGHVAEALATELQALAVWQALSAITCGRRGDLSRDLGQALKQV
jgi:uncharacterized protein YcaQ